MNDAGVHNEVHEAVGILLYAPHHTIQCLITAESCSYLNSPLKVTLSFQT